MIHIELNRVGDDYHMVANNGEGNEVHMDASPDIGGAGKGMRPMQLLLTSLAGCSTIDVISILKKQKQNIEGLKVSIEGLRKENVNPSPFRKIHMKFSLSGEIDKVKLQRAVSLSIEKYCSVLATLDKGVEVTYESEVVN